MTTMDFGSDGSKREDEGMEALKLVMAHKLDMLGWIRVNERSGLLQMTAMCEYKPWMVVRKTHLGREKDGGSSVSMRSDLRFHTVRRLELVY
jgi:hypothetical protein